MAKAPESILALWQELSDAHLNVSSTFWDIWTSGFNAPLLEMRLILYKASTDHISAEENERLYKHFNDVKRFFLRIEPSETKRTEIVGSIVMVNPLLFGLIRHHLGNDLHIIGMFLDINYADEEVLSADSIRIVLNITQEMLNFWNRVRSETVLA